MNFQIETAKEEYIPAIIELMREFAEYENLLDFLEITEEKLHEALFGEDGFVDCLIATSDEKPFAPSEVEGRTHVPRLGSARTEK